MFRQTEALPLLLPKCDDLLVGPRWLVKRLVFLVLAVSTLFAQGTRSQPLEIGGDRLWESTAEFRADNPNCFLPMDRLPGNYEVFRWQDLTEGHKFNCQVTSASNDQLHLLGFRVLKKSVVIVNDHVAGIYYDLPRTYFSAIKSALRDRLGEPTEVDIDGYIGHEDGCKGEVTHWSNEVSGIVLEYECEHDGVATVNLGSAPKYWSQ
jgi:hypothetical protein